MEQRVASWLSSFEQGVDATGRQRVHIAKNANLLALLLSLPEDLRRDRLTPARADRATCSRSGALPRESCGRNTLLSSGASSAGVGAAALPLVAFAHMCAVACRGRVAAFDPLHGCDYRAFVQRVLCARLKGRTVRRRPTPPVLRVCVEPIRHPVLIIPGVCKTEPLTTVLDLVATPLGTAIGP
jgi:hypothetical protein